MCAQRVVGQRFAGNGPNCLSYYYYYYYLSKIYLPELLERVSAGEVVKADCNLSICINFILLICHCR